jgi:excisionase family DNA binding protein
MTSTDPEHPPPPPPWPGREDPLRLLTVAQVAQVAYVSEYTVWRWIRSEELGHLRLGRNMVRIPEDKLQAFLAERTRNPPKPGRRPKGVA